MKIQFLCIGKENDANLKAAIQDFTTRINRYYPSQWKIIPSLKNTASLSENELKSKEAQLILNCLQKNDYLISLDEKGKMLDSKKLSDFIQTRANESARQLVFLIGGAYGLHDSIVKRSDFIWSLSLLTFPHQLVRLILVEQVYRASTILQNEKYHHE